MKIIIAIILVLVILWSFYSIYLILDDRVEDSLVITAKAYWWIIMITILFMFSYGIVDKIIK
jgi:Na+-driven multidrug efflux pump